MTSLYIGEQEMREAAEAQFGIPASACIALELLEELGKSTLSDDPWLLELVGAFQQDLRDRQAEGTLTHADLMASKRISQLMDCMAFNEGRTTAAELAQKNGLFANVDMSGATLGDPVRDSERRGAPLPEDEGADE